MDIDPTRLHPSIAHFIPLFAYEHLPPGPRGISSLFSDLAEKVMRNCEGPEATVALRKLLEAKDAAVRGCLDGGFAHRKAAHPTSASMPRNMSESEAKACIGTSVVTADRINLIRSGWTHPRKGRAAYAGKIVGYSNSHGLCFQVRHAGGDKHWYDPDELTVGDGDKEVFK